MPKTHGSVISLIDGFLKEARAGDLEKKASNLDLAGDAKSTHPSASVDDKTKPATEGSRSSENEADVKKSVPNSINNADTENTDGKGNEGATVNGDQGTVTMGADSGLKGNVDTPKKDHSQSMSDSGPGDGGESFKGNYDKASAAGELVGEANGLLADVAMLTGAVLHAQPQVKATSGVEQKSASQDSAVDAFAKAAEAYPEDVEAGYVAAALLAQRMGLVKGAAAIDATETQMVAGVVKAASLDAENYVEFLRGFASEMQKAAAPMVEDPAALAALAGDGDAGGEPGLDEMAAGAGDEEAGAALEGLGGGEEAAGAEEMLGAGAEGGAGGGESDEGLVQAIAKVLVEAGIDPAELAEAVAQQSAGGAELGAAGGVDDGGGEVGGGEVAPEVM